MAKHRTRPSSEDGARVSSARTRSVHLLKEERGHKMIVRRSFHRVNQGRMADAIAAARELADELPGAVRLYQPMFGSTRGTLCIEMEFESLAALEQSLADWQGTPSAEAFMKKWRDTTDSHAEIQIWRTPE
jgi:hypothetical protein